MSVSETRTVYPCPLCGRTLNRKGRPFTEPGQTAAHINGGHDPKHVGEHGEDHLDEIRENGRQVTEAEIDDRRDEMRPVDTSTTETADSAEIDEMSVEVHGDERDVPGAFHYLGAFAQATKDDVSKNRDRVDDLRDEVLELRERLESLQEAVDVYELPCGHFADGEPLREARGDYRTVTCTTCGNRYQIDAVIED
jgi:hypothetical protein